MRCVRSRQSETAMTIAAPLAVGRGRWSCSGRSSAGARNVPVFLFPKPSDIAAEARERLADLARGARMTLRVALQAFVAAIVIGTLIAFLFVQSRAIEMSFFPYAVLLQVTPIVAIAPLIIILVKNTQVALTVCATVVALFPIISNTTLGLRSVDPGPGQPVPHEPGGPAADAVAPAHSERAAVLLRRLADLERAGADRGGGRRIRRRHRRTQRRAGLRDPAVRLPARHSAHVRGALPHHAGGRRPVHDHDRAFRSWRSGQWHESEVGAET